MGIQGTCAGGNQQGEQETRGPQSIDVCTDSRIVRTLLVSNLNVVTRRAVLVKLLPDGTNEPSLEPRELAGPRQYSAQFILRRIVTNSFGDHLRLPGALRGYMCDHP